MIKELCHRRIDVFNRLIFVIIPMVNVDGVVIGNGRTGALGKDLNREFHSNNNMLNVEVVRIKYFIEKLQEYY